MAATEHPFYLPSNDVALVVVDFQERLAAVLDDKVRAATVRGMSVMIRAAQRLGVATIVTEQYPSGLGPTIAELRALTVGCETSEKVSFDCCGAPDFLPLLRRRGVRSVVLTGMETHICVLQTALGLIDEGFAVWVARDAVCSRSKANWKAGLELLSKAGAVVAPVESLLFMWLKRAATPEFKELSSLIK